MAPKSKEFIVSDSHDSSDEESKPKAKKAKVEKKKETKRAKKADSDEESGAESDEDHKGSGGSGSMERDADGKEFMHLGGKTRRVQVNPFKGNILIDIRELYEKDGKHLPGKKGISLKLDEWKALLAGADEINAAIKRVKK